MATEQFDYEELLKTALEMSPARRAVFLDKLPPRQQAYVIRKLAQKNKQRATGKFDIRPVGVENIPIDEDGSPQGIDSITLGTGSIDEQDITSASIESVDLPTLMMTESVSLDDEVRVRSEADTADAAEMLADLQASQLELKDAAKSASTGAADGPTKAPPKNESDDTNATIDTGENSDSEAAKVKAASRSARVHLLRPHARGSIGEIFVAYDDQLSREVALKRIRPELAGKKRHVTRFIREAAITAQLQHPGIVPIYNLGSHNKSSHYTMPLVCGSTLAEAVDEAYKELGSSPTADEWMSKLRPLLNRFIAICNAIDYAHSRKVLHRDLKPSNIMIGTQGQTLVLDWGCAKLLDELEEVETETRGDSDPGTVVEKQKHGSSSDSVSGLHKADVTIAGTVLGTVEFMSPEQAAGESESLGPQCDVFGLGATLFNLLTNKTAIGSARDIEASLAKVRAGEFRRIKETNPLVPGPLIAICERSMRVRIEDRYQTAGELGAEIEAFLAGEKVETYAEPVGEKFRRFTRDNRTMLALMLGMVLVGVASLVPVKLMIDKQRAMASVTNHRIDALQKDVEFSNDEDRRRLAASTSREKIMRRGLYTSQMVLATQAYTSPQGQNRAQALVAKWRGSRHAIDVGWEWHHLDQALRSNSSSSNNDRGKSKSTINFGGETTSQFPAFAWHPKGNLLVVANGAEVFVHSTSNASFEVGKIDQVDEITAIGFNNSGERIAVAAKNGSVQTFSVTREKVGPKRNISIIIEPVDVKLLVEQLTKNEQSTVASPTTLPNTTPTTTSKSFCKIGWSNDDRYLASINLDSLARVWDTQTNEELDGLFDSLSDASAKESVEASSIRCKSFSWAPDSTKIALATMKNGVVIVDVAERKIVARLLHSKHPTAIDWSDNGRHLAIASERSISILEFDTGNRQRKCHGSMSRIVDLSWNGTYNRIAALNEQGVMHLWATSDGQMTAQYELHQHHPWAIGWSPNGKAIISTTQNGSIVLQQIQ